MIENLITALMLIVAGIHLLPVSGFVGARQLERLYDIPIGNPDLQIMMRHRAVLFGILGIFLGYSAFVPALQPLGFAAAAISVGSFLYLALAVGGYGRAIRKVVFVDAIAACCLAAAIGLYGIAG